MNRGRRLADAGRGFLGGLEPRDDWEGCEEGGGKEVLLLLLLLSDTLLPKLESEKMEEILFPDRSIVSCRGFFASSTRRMESGGESRKYSAVG